MEPEPQEDKAINAIILIEVPQVVMHRLIANERSQFSSGTCKVAKIENPDSRTVFFLNLNSFYYTLNNSVTFVKIEYDDTVSYLFPHFDSGLSSLTLLKNDTMINNFEEILRNAAELLTFEQAMTNPEISDKFKQHCPGVEKSAIVCADKPKQVIKETGKMLGSAFRVLGGYMSQGIKYAGSFIDQKTQESPNKADVAPETKQKWESLKNGTNSALEVSKQVFNKYLMPVIDKGAEYGKQVSKQVNKKIDDSDNPSIKYAKELVGVSGQALGQAYTGLAQGLGEVTTSVSEETKKIVNKKYGEDYVKTFIEGETEGQPKLNDDQAKPLLNQQTKTQSKEPQKDEGGSSEKNSQNDQKTVQQTGVKDNLYPQLGEVEKNNQ